MLKLFYVCFYYWGWKKFLCSIARTTKSPEDLKILSALHCHDIAESIIHNPITDPKTLSVFATEYPQLLPNILTHPHCSELLKKRVKDWIDGKEDLALDRIDTNKKQEFKRLLE